MSTQFRLYRGTEQLSDRNSLVDTNDGNAARLLDALGLPVQQEGELPLPDFLGRVLVALAVEPADEGVPAHDTSPRWTEGGRRPGKLQELLDELRTLCELGRTYGDDVEVVWS
jgi:hypothetical protein